MKQGVSFSHRRNAGVGSELVWWLPPHPMTSWGPKSLCFWSTQVPKVKSQMELAARACAVMNTEWGGEELQKTTERPLLAEWAPSERPVCHTSFHLYLMGQNLVTQPHVAARGAGKPSLDSRRQWLSSKSVFCQWRTEDWVVIFPFLLLSLLLCNVHACHQSWFGFVFFFFLGSVS